MCVGKYVDKPLRAMAWCPSALYVQRCPRSGKCRLVRDSILCRYALGRDTSRVFPFIAGRAVKTVWFGHEKDSSNTNSCSHHQEYAIGTGTTSRTAARQAGPRWPCAFGSPGR